MAITMVAMLVLSPHSHAYDCLFIMLAAALTLPSIRLNRLFAMTKSWDGPDQAEPSPGFAGKVGYRIWMACLYFYPVITWALFLPLNDPNNKMFPRAFALLDTLILLAGIAAYFASSHKSKKAE